MVVFLGQLKLSCTGRNTCSNCQGVYHLGIIKELTESGKCQGIFTEIGISQGIWVLIPPRDVPS